MRIRSQIAVVVLGLNLLACAAAREPERAGEAAGPRSSALASPPAVGPEVQFDSPVRVQSDGPGLGIAAGASNHLFV